MKALATGPFLRRVVPALVAGMAAALLGWLGLASPLDDLVHQALRPPSTRPPAVVVLGIDDSASWSNARLAALIERLRLAGVRGIAVDLPLAAGADGDAAGDAQLARALLDSRVVVGVPLRARGEAPPEALLPPVEFADGTRLGHLELQRDRDGRIRRHLPHMLTMDGIRWPSLPLALVQPGSSTDAGSWETGERWRVPYPRPGPPTWRAVDVLQERIGADRLRGKWVLLGLTDPARQARVPGPHGSGALYPVEHQARTVAMLLHGTAPREVPAPVQALLAMLVAAGAVFIGLGRREPGWRLPAAALVGMAVSLAACGWLFERQYWFAPGATLVVLGLALLAWAVAQARRQWITRRRMPGLATRRSLHAALQASRTGGMPHALLLVEARVPAGGDGEALATRLAGLLRARARRPGDVAAYLGDGRFALLLPGTSAAAAERILDTLRDEADAQALPLLGSVHACGSGACDCLWRLALRAQPVQPAH
ncbi:CHASE2 domain-containing protein [Pseudoxanthomonas suwonensis]|uniref:CHASE2 domain-containing protein n=1 Tax=Pseudoxanthomonas suwonensis TaxID=314722 RepID=UPI00046646C9|nr:CHASE2 domain-containing protein [Pseudoxanthomonas suwonensis]